MAFADARLALYTRHVPGKGSGFAQVLRGRT